MDPSNVSALLKIGIMILIGICILVAVVLYLVRKEKRVEDAKAWPRTEARVQSAEFEVVAHGRYVDIELPCFAFSYVVAGEYYSGRFALNAQGDKADELMKEMIDKKLEVHYDPQSPEKYYLPYDTLEGCEVEQKIGLNLVKLYPTD
jgi:hypothetical protein